MDSRYSVTLLGVIILAVVVGIVAAHSQPRLSAAPIPSSTPTPVPTPLPGHVDIVSYPSGNPDALYVPTTLNVRVGDKVIWNNTATDDHTVSADNGAFSSDVLDPGQSFTWTARHPGTYYYSCFLHPDMHGVIVVYP